MMHSSLAYCIMNVGAPQCLALSTKSFFLACLLSADSDATDDDDDYDDYYYDRANA